MRTTRRRFLGYTAGGLTGITGASLWWASVSQHRAARWLRRIAEDSRREVLPAGSVPRPQDWSDNRITLAWLGHATVLINFFGVRIITDPALGARVGISLGLGTAGPKRYIAPALNIKRLPAIDLVLLSHAHMDHMDIPTLRRLRRFGMPAISASLTADILQDAGLKQVTELRWGQSHCLRTSRGELEIEAFQVKHWGERWPSEKPRGYNGYILKREGKSLLFGGDTADTDLFKQLRSQAPFEVAIMPIGAYRPWIWNHCTPEEAVRMTNDAGANYVLPVHHQTFKLSEEPLSEPIERLTATLEKEPGRLAWTHVGETFVCPS